jgi:hypothetical protein
VDKAAGTFYMKSWTVDPVYICASDLYNDTCSAETTSPGPKNVLSVTEPIIKKEIYDIDYDLSAGEIFDQAPYVALDVWVENYSSSTQSETVKYIVKYSEVGSWLACCPAIQRFADHQLEQPGRYHGRSQGLPQCQNSLRCRRKNRTFGHHQLRPFLWRI